MRYQIMCGKQTDENPHFQCFFESDDLDEAKAFAMRLAFSENNSVYVYDDKVGDRVRNFDDQKYRL